MGNAHQSGEGGEPAGSPASGKRQATVSHKSTVRSDVKRRKQALSDEKNRTVPPSKSNTCQQELQAHHLPPLVVIDSPKSAAPRSGSETSSLVEQQKQPQQADCVTNSTSPNARGTAESGSEVSSRQLPNEKSPALPALIKGDEADSGDVKKPRKQRNLVNRSVSALNMMNSSPGMLQRLSSITGGASSSHQKRPQTEKRLELGRQVSVGQVPRSTVDALSFEQYQLGIESQRRKVREWLDSQPFNEDHKQSLPPDLWTTASSQPEPSSDGIGLGATPDQVSSSTRLPQSGVSSQDKNRVPEAMASSTSSTSHTNEEPPGVRAISTRVGGGEPQLVASEIMANGQTVFSLKEASQGGHNTISRLVESSSTFGVLEEREEETQERVEEDASPSLIGANDLGSLEGLGNQQQQAVGDTCSLCLYLESIRVAIVRKSGSSAPIEPTTPVACCHERSRQASGCDQMQPDARSSVDNNRNSGELASSSAAANDGSSSSSSSSSSSTSSSSSSSAGLSIIGTKDAIPARLPSAVKRTSKVNEQHQLADTRSMPPTHHQLDAQAMRPASAHSDLCPEPANSADEEDATDEEPQHRQDDEPELTGVSEHDMLTTKARVEDARLRVVGSESLIRRSSFKASRVQSLDEALSIKQVVSGKTNKIGQRPITKQPVRGRHHLQPQQRRLESQPGTKLIVINSKNVSYTIQVAVQAPGAKATENHLIKAKGTQKLELGQASLGKILEDASNNPRSSNDQAKKFLVKKIPSKNQKSHGKHTSVIGGSTVVDNRSSEDYTTDADGNRKKHSPRQLNQRSDNNGPPKTTTSDTETGCSQLTRDCQSLTNSSVSSAEVIRSYSDSIMKAVHQQIAGFKPVTETLFPDEQAKSCSQAAKRLRELVAHLEHGSVPQSILYQTLEYAASVLDSVTMDQISRDSDEEDGDLSEVQSDAVPNEVRKWLETTFTRNSISQKRKSEDKLKFRSVANAIRAGIVVDRIYRRMSASTPFVSAEVSNLLKSIDDWSFDCFSVNQVSGGQVLKSVGYELFNRYGLMYKFKIPTVILKNFLTQVESGYVKHKNPYHNNLHAADVTQTVHYMLWQAGLTSWLSDLEIFATLIAAIIHDYLHTGTTNNFHVMSQSDTALVYNDRAVLENFHICQAFTLMKNEDCNILAGLSKYEYREFRSLVIDMVLATDMSSHFQQIKAMKNILNHSENFNADKSKILSLVIHISDISHPAKDWDLHSNWTQLLMEEFFRQGDREKELDLECSPLCDRETTLVAESQLGFIEFIVSPSLEICGDVLDRVHYFMAEANARPVLSASAKAASALAPPSSGQVAAIEPPTADQATCEKVGSRVVSASSSRAKQPTTGTGDTPANDRRPSSAASSIASRANSFVGSTENTLTSNLRKMIVSSSATISRKLNISSASLVGSCSSSSATAHQAAASTTTTTTSNQVAAAKCATLPPVAEPDDFERRQANYKHPVIKSEPLPSPGGRPRSSLEASSEPNQLARPGDSQKRISSSSLAVTGTGANKLATRPTSGQTVIQPLVTKIIRPWIKCLERNKKMWQERALQDAKVREMKAKQEQSQIEEAPEGEEEKEENQ